MSCGRVLNSAIGYSVISYNKGRREAKKQKRRETSNFRKKNRQNYFSLSIITFIKMASAMDVDMDEVEMPTSSSSKGEKKRFEVKKVVE